MPVSISHHSNTKGETALHGAADRGADSIVQFLVDHGAKLNAKTSRDSRRWISPWESSLLQLPVPHDSTVALLRKLGGLEGKDVK